MFTVGAGYLDITAVLANYQKAYSSAPSPAIFYDEWLKSAFLVPDLTSTFWNNLTWLSSEVWGNSALVPGPLGVPVIWGSNATWASRLNASWGTSLNASWGTNASWGSNLNASWGTNLNASWGTATQGEK
jgi:hypothetical protein